MDQSESVAPQLDGEAVTRDILKDLITYRISKREIQIQCKDNVKNFIRKTSDYAKAEIDIKESLKLEYLLGNLQALEYLMNALYQNAKTKEQYVFYTICLFTYIAELCKNASKESHRLIADNVIVVLKSNLQGQYVLHLFQKMYEWEKTKSTLKKITLCAAVTVGIFWFMKKSFE